MHDLGARGDLDAAIRDARQPAFDVASQAARGGKFTPS